MSCGTSQVLMKRTMLSFQAFSGEAKYCGAAMTATRYVEVPHVGMEPPIMAMMKMRPRSVGDSSLRPVREKQAALKKTRVMNRKATDSGR